MGENPPNGAVIFYNLKQKPDSTTVVKLEFMTAKGDSITTFSSKPAPKVNSESSGDEGTPAINHSKKLSTKAGMNRFVWNLEYPAVKNPPNKVLGSSGGTLDGPKVTPGTYKVKLIVGNQSMTQSFQVIKDPRINASKADLQAQFKLLQKIHHKQNQTARAVNHILAAKKQIHQYLDNLKGYSKIDAIRKQAQPVLDSLQAVEDQLYQPGIHHSEDDLANPVRLWIKLASLNSYVRSAYSRPADQSYALYDSLSTAVDQQFHLLKPVLQQQVSQFNQMIRNMNIPAIYLKKE